MMCARPSSLKSLWICSARAPRWRGMTAHHPHRSLCGSVCEFARNLLSLMLLPCGCMPAVCAFTGAFADAAEPPSVFAAPSAQLDDCTNLLMRCGAGPSRIALASLLAQRHAQHSGRVARCDTACSRTVVEAGQGEGVACGSLGGSEPPFPAQMHAAGGLFNYSSSRACMWYLLCLHEVVDPPRR